MVKAYFINKNCILQRVLAREIIKYHRVLKVKLFLVFKDNRLIIKVVFSTLIAIIMLN